MSLPIFFSPTAEHTLLSITKLIKDKWGKRTSDKFRIKVDKTLRILQDQPFIFKASDFSPEIRKGIVSKQTSFIYQVYSDRIQIHFFIDNRQDPIT